MPLAGKIIRKNMETSELMQMGIDWLAHAPEAPRHSDPRLLGFTGRVGFVCRDCMFRMSGRGCNTNVLASEPVYAPTNLSTSCAFVGQHPAILGGKPCGCVCAIDLEDTPEHRAEYESRGYTVRIVPRVEAVKIWRTAEWPCRHMRQEIESNESRSA